jgi:hypothetical protein
MYFTNKQLLAKHKVLMDIKLRRNEIDSEIKNGIVKTVGFIGISIIAIFFTLILINIC